MATSLKPIELLVTVSRLSLGCNCWGKSSFLVHAGKFGEWPTSPHEHLQTSTFQTPSQQILDFLFCTMTPLRIVATLFTCKRGSLIFSTVCQTFIDQRFYLASLSIIFFVVVFSLFQRCRLSNLGRWQVRSLLLELLHCSLLNVFILHIYKYIKEEEIPFTTAEFGIYVNAFIHRHDFKCLVVS